MKTHIRYLLGFVLALGLLLGSLSSARALDLSLNVGIAPPPLPVYAQPACPGLGYLWAPGYWAWDPNADSYYWVPGSWTLAPEIGFLWTPAWWGCDNGAYFFHAGYWGPQVGFYGGINYGFGYYGRGYDGGYWRDRHFFYNRAVNNVGAFAASRTYSRAVETSTSRVSFNGPGGTTARATATELQAGREHRLAATPAQNAQIRAAEADPSMRYATNRGRPAITSTTRAGEFHSATASTAAVSRATTAESAYTGETRTAAAERTEQVTAAQREHAANVSAEEHRSAAATESRRAEVARSENREAESRARVSESHVAEVNHAPSYHAAAHAPAFHEAAHAGGGGHAPAAHASGGGGGRIR